MAPQASLPHNYHAIVQNADSKIDMSSVNKLYDQLYNGVFLNHKKKKFSVDKDSGANSFELFARALSFVKGEWKWYEADNMEVAEAKYAQDFEVQITMDMKCLTPSTCYEVAFVIMIMTEFPVTLKIVVPDGTSIEREENLSDKPKCAWIELPVVKFTTSSHPTGVMKISMSGKGIIACKEVIIRPGKKNKA